MFKVSISTGRRRWRNSKVRVFKCVDTRLQILNHIECTLKTLCDITCFRCGHRRLRVLVLHNNPVLGVVVNNACLLSVIQLVLDVLSCHIEIPVQVNECHKVILYHTIRQLPVLWNKINLCHLANLLALELRCDKHLSDIRVHTRDKHACGSRHYYYVSLYQLLPIVISLSLKQPPNLEAKRSLWSKYISNNSHKTPKPCIVKKYSGKK